MADFSSACAATLKAEGGYVNNPKDPGGETYKGIARKRNPAWSGWAEIDAAKQKGNFPASLEDSRTLQENLQSFYRSNYWNQIRGDEIADQRIAASVFDFAVNAGVATSARLAQATVNEPVDGIIGTSTLKKLNADDPRAFLANFALQKIARYVSICEQKPESREFFFGWVKRTLA